MITENSFYGCNKRRKIPLQGDGRKNEKGNGKYEILLKIPPQHKKERSQVPGIYIRISLASLIPWPTKILYRWIRILRTERTDTEQTRSNRRKFLPFFVSNSRISFLVHMVSQSTSTRWTDGGEKNNHQRLCYTRSRGK